MKTLLYCCHSWRINNWLGLARAGVFTRPLTCPPLDAGSFPYSKLAGVDLVYMALHGAAYERDLLYGDDWRAALSIEALRRRAPDMSGAVVVLEGCYGMRTRFPHLFRALGAAAVIASARPTWDRTLSLGRAGRYGSTLVRALRQGATVRDAMAVAADVVDADTAMAFVLAGEPDVGVRRTTP